MYHKIVLLLVLLGALFCSSNASVPNTTLSCADALVEEVISWPLVTEELTKKFFPTGSSYMKISNVRVNLNGTTDYWIISTRRIFLDLTTTLVSVLSWGIVTPKLEVFNLDFTNSTDDEWKQYCDLTNKSSIDHAVALAITLLPKRIASLLVNSDDIIFFPDSACKYKDHTENAWDKCYRTNSGEEVFDTPIEYYRTTKLILYLSLVFAIVGAMWSILRRDKIGNVINNKILSLQEENRNSFLISLKQSDNNVSCSINVSSTPLKYFLVVVIAPCLLTGVYVGMGIRFFFQKDVVWDTEIRERNILLSFILGTSGLSIILWLFVSCLNPKWKIRPDMFWEKTTKWSKKVTENAATKDDNIGTEMKSLNVSVSESRDSDEAMEKGETQTETRDPEKEQAVLPFMMKKIKQYVKVILTQDNENKPPKSLYYYAFFFSSLFLQVVSVAIFAYFIPFVVLGIFWDPDNAIPKLTLYITNAINLFGAVMNILRYMNFRWDLKINLSFLWLGIFNNDFVKNFTSHLQNMPFKDKSPRKKLQIFCRWFPNFKFKDFGEWNILQNISFGSLDLFDLGDFKMGHLYVRLPDLRLGRDIDLEDLLNRFKDKRKHVKVDVVDFLEYCSRMKWILPDLKFHFDFFAKLNPIFLHPNGSLLSWTLPELKLNRLALDLPPVSLSLMIEALEMFDIAIQLPEFPQFAEFNIDLFSLFDELEIPNFNIKLHLPLIENFRIHIGEINRFWDIEIGIGHIRSMLEKIKDDDSIPTDFHIPDFIFKLPAFNNLLIRWLGLFLSELDIPDFIPSSFPEFQLKMSRMELPSYELALERIHLALSFDNLQFKIYGRLILFAKHFKLQSLLDGIAFNIRNRIQRAYKDTKSRVKHLLDDKEKKSHKWFEDFVAFSVTDLLQLSGIKMFWGYFHFCTEIALLVLLQCIIYYGLLLYIGNSNVFVLLHAVGFGIVTLISRVIATIKSNTQPSISDSVNAIVKLSGNETLAKANEVATKAAGFILPKIQKLNDHSVIDVNNN